jgi:phenylpropionate dioxygenase-like ring-hydroxylating dioxygenase large terminal subunit
LNVAALVEDIAETARLALPQARTLPAASYTDEAWFAHEAETCLQSGWLCAAHVSQLSAPGAVLPIEFVGEPILLVHGDDGVIRALSRVCPHRAADILPADCSARRSVLTCPYHRWSFGLDGRLIGAPHMQGAADFEKSEFSLATIRSEIWQGFVFVNLDGTAPPLEREFAAFTETVAPWRMAELELAISLDWDCHFNWKVMVENWIESYHHLGPHSKTLNVFMPAQDTWSEPPNPAFIHAHLPMTGRDAAPVLEAIRNNEPGPGFLPLPGLSAQAQAEWSVFVGFPCFMLLTARDRVIWYRLQPISASRCKLTTTTLIARENAALANYAELLAAETKMLRDFHMEDMEVNEAVQRGLSSRHVRRGRLSHLEEPVWQFHRQLAARLQA